MDQMIGTIQLFAGDFAPRGWAFCEGQLLSISSNTALFSILGTKYGGDGRTTFGLPDLRGRVVIAPGVGPGLSSYRLGEKAGVETVTLNTNQMPSHTHSATATYTPSDQHVQLSTTNAVNSEPMVGDVPAPANFVDGLATKNVKSFGPPSAADVDGQPLSGNVAVQISPTGASQAHENRQPYLAINYIIALQGIFPSRS